MTDETRTTIMTIIKCGVLGNSLETVLSRLAVIVLTGVLSACSDAGLNTLESASQSEPNVASAEGNDTENSSTTIDANNTSESEVEITGSGRESNIGDNTVDTANAIYTSSTTPDFTATVLDDAVQISWSEDGRARGYNIYKQGEYHATVFDNSYIDEEISRSEVSYEIVAFDNDDNYFDIATGLVIPEDTFEQSSTNSVQASNGSTTDSSTIASGGENSGQQTDTSEPEIGAAEELNPDNSEQGTDSSSTETDSTSSTDIQAGKETDGTSTGTDNITSFKSVTTPGFEGEVAGETIIISWNADASARGYNVYRQAEYYTTVFETEFTDTKVYDGDYYYEIQAFDYNEKFYYIATGLTVSVTKLGKTDPNAPKVNEDLLKDYELVFSDDFNGSTLDKSKWNTSFIWGTDLFINNEEQYYVDINNEPDFGFNPFTFDGEHMTINTIETPTHLASKALNQPYLSGIITSYDAFKFTYGYAETRAKLTHGRGYWPAFWLLNAYYGTADPEIDIMEFIGHNQDVVYHTYHYFDQDYNLVSSPSVPVPGSDYTADFHTFGAEWMPGKIIFYINGIETYRIEDPNVSSEEMYVLANQAVGGWWAGSPDDTTPFPGKYIIDYIRVYQRVTPYNSIQSDYMSDPVTLIDEDEKDSIPNKRPTYQQWPQGYPWR